MTTKVIPKIISKQIVVEGKPGVGAYTSRSTELQNSGIFRNYIHSLKLDYDGHVGMPSRHHVSVCYDAD